MNIKKQMLIPLLLSVLLVCTACEYDPQLYDSPYIPIDVEFNKDGVISISDDGKTAVFDDGHITFSWNCEDWIYTLENGMPSLETLVDGMRYRVAVIAREEGIADDLSSFARKAIEDDLTDGKDYVDVWGATINTLFSPIGCVGLDTGAYYEHPGSQASTLCRLYAVTNSEQSAVICVSFEGIRESVRTLYDNNFTDGVDWHLIETEAIPVLKTFRFVNSVRK